MKVLKIHIECIPKVMMVALIIVKPVSSRNNVNSRIL